jgi:hypothetical protein
MHGNTYLKDLKDTIRVSYTISGVVAKIKNLIAQLFLSHEK